MARIKICLFDKFSALYDGQPGIGLSPYKVQEIFCFLLLNRHRNHHRETLASILWGGESTLSSRKHLRQALWQLNKILNAQVADTSAPVFMIELDWICFNPEADLWLDVAAFEQPFIHARGIPGGFLDAEQVQALSEAVNLYRGELLTGWYQDWCMLERDRLHNIYLEMLDKLIENCDVSRQYETGIEYGERSLQSDPALERTHRRMMRIYYLAGNRTGALRQYEKCLEALHRDLDTKPEPGTEDLYRIIRSGQPLSEPSPVHLIDHLKQIELLLSEAQQQIRRDIQVLAQERGRE